MNKTIACLILGVILLAMALIMINQYTSLPEETATLAPVTPTAQQPAHTPSGGTPLGSTALTPVPPPASLPQSPQARPPMPEMAAGAQPSALPQWATNMPGHLPPSATAPSQATHAAGTNPNAGNSTPASAPPAPASPAKPAVAKPAPAAHPAPAQTAAPAQTSAPAKNAAPAKTAAPTASTKAPGPKTIKKIVVSSVKEGANVRFDGSEPLSYKTMHLTGPERLVIDFQGTWAVKAPGVPSNKYVTNVRIGKQADKTRVVIDMRQPPASIKFVKVGADDLEVRIR